MIDAKTLMTMDPNDVTDLVRRTSEAGRYVLARDATRLVKAGMPTDREMTAYAAMFKALGTSRLVLSTWSTLMQGLKAPDPRALVFHRYTVATVLAVFEVPMGAAGLGVKPKVPSEPAAGMMDDSTYFEGLVTAAKAAGTLDVEETV